MDELVRWLRVQLDEDERTARAAHAPNWSTDGRRGLHYGVEDGWMTDALTTADADHIARHDPARVLREIDAKRRILEIHQVVGGWENEDGQDIGLGCDECGYSAEYSDRGGWCETIRLLALPYADRPGYQESWRP